jgi:hypothetical protein
MDRFCSSVNGAGAFCEGGRTKAVVFLEASRTEAVAFLVASEQLHFPKNKGLTQTSIAKRMQIHPTYLPQAQL